MNILTPAEEQLMLEIWPMQDFYMKDLMARLPEPKPHQNTVSTYLKILTEKGFVSPEKQGRIFRYHAAIRFADYKKAVLKALIGKYFHGSGNEVIDFLFEEKLVSQAALAKYFDVKIEMKPFQKEQTFAIADDILQNAAKKKKKKKKK